MFDFIDWSKLNTPAEWTLLVIGAGVVAFMVWAYLNRKKIQNNESLDAKTIETYEKNNAALEERVKIVEQETKDCEANHAKSQKDIAALQGEIKAYKELVLIPADFIKELQRNQKEIIKLLKGKK